MHFLSFPPFRQRSEKEGNEGGIFIFMFFSDTIIINVHDHFSKIFCLAISVIGDFVNVRKEARVIFFQIFIPRNYENLVWIKNVFTCKFAEIDIGH